MLRNLNLTYAFRTLRRSPLFACAAVLSLALAIGANTAIFSIVNALMLHPAGVDRPEQVVAPRVTYKKLHLNRIAMSATDFADVQSSRKVFASAAMTDLRPFNYTSGDSPLRLLAGAVTWQWFEVFHAKPLLGRGFRAEEDKPGANHVTVLSYETWQKLFAGDPSIVNRSIELNRAAFHVVGVMPPDFHWPSQADLWVPMGLAAKDYGPGNRFNESYFVVARLAPGVSFSQAASFMPILRQHLIDTDPQQGQFVKSSEWSMNLEPLTEYVAGDLKQPVLLLLGAVGFLLLIACSNIAGLLLARGTGRARELAIRTAIGATTSNLLTQAFAESLLLSAGGTAIGLAGAFGILELLLSFAPPQFTSGLVIGIDIHVLAFTIGVGLLAAIFFGLAPAWQMTRLGGQYGRLKEGGRSDTEGKHRQRLRAFLVTCQVGLTLVLLVGAGLFLKTLSNLHGVNAGFRPENVATASISLPEEQYKDPDRQTRFFRSVREKLLQTPGVVAAGIVTSLPFSGDNSTASFGIEGRIERPGDPGPHGGISQVSPGYFEALRIPLLLGRHFTDGDRKSSQAVAIIDETMARQYWPDENPLGKRLRHNSADPWATIVGVVAHVNHSKLAGEVSRGTYYFSMDQQPRLTAFLVLRTVGSPAQGLDSIRDAVHSVDPTQAVFDLKTMEQRVDVALGPQQFAVFLLSGFSGVALFLAALGLYGVISYNVSQRTREIGIRAALGANRGQILGMVIVQGVRLVGIGAVVGLVIASWLGRLISAQLFNVSPFDSGIFGLTLLILGTTAFLAAYVPAWRATRVDPLTALRQE
jgi:predicted permease